MKKIKSVKAWCVHYQYYDILGKYRFARNAGHEGRWYPLARARLLERAMKWMMTPIGLTNSNRMQTMKLRLIEGWTKLDKKENDNGK
jgi:hypothetical protein